MSMLGGLAGGSSDSDFQPSKAPKVPKRSDEGTDNNMMNYYRKLAKQDSYSRALLGGSHAGPTKSYTSQLFGGSV